MIPVKLSLRNFMCYADSVAPLDFRGFRLACLSGDNGHGKSALLDAITWALWGQARARTDDELIHLGRSEMEVEFEFQLGDSHYRVVRKRSRPRSGRGAGQTVLELSLAGEDGSFRAITGNSVRETEARIVELLGMGYDTFINSAFLLQGRADEFTVKPPAERKRVLAEILGLTLYDDLEKRAREQIRYWENEQQALERTIVEIDRELERRPQYEAERQEMEKALGELEQQDRVLEANLRLVRERKRTLDMSSGQLAAARERLAGLRRDLEGVEAQVAEHGRLVQSYEAALARRDEVVAGFAGLVEARQANEALGARLSQALELNGRLGKLESAVQAARHKLATEQQVLESNLRSLRERVQKAAAAQVEQARAQEGLAACERQEEQRKALLDRSQILVAEIHHIQSENAGLKVEMETLKEKIEAPGGGGFYLPSLRERPGRSRPRSDSLPLSSRGKGPGRRVPCQQYAWRGAGQGAGDRPPRAGASGGDARPRARSSGSAAGRRPRRCWPKPRRRRPR